MDIERRKNPGGRPAKVTYEMLRQIDRLMIRKLNGKVGWETPPKCIAWRFDISERTLLDAHLRRKHYRRFPPKDVLANDERNESLLEEACAP
jgi:hypothetical protein